MNPQRENSGILFKNDRKASERHPDYKGNATIGGEEFYLSAWVKQGRNGKFLSLSFTSKADQRQGQPVNGDDDRPPQDDDLDTAMAPVDPGAPAPAFDDAVLRQQTQQRFSEAAKSRRW